MCRTKTPRFLRISSDNPSIPSSLTPFIESALVWSICALSSSPSPWKETFDGCKELSFSSLASEISDRSAEWGASAEAPLGSGDAVSASPGVHCERTCEDVGLEPGMRDSDTTANASGSERELSEPARCDESAEPAPPPAPTMSARTPRGRPPPSASLTVVVTERLPCGETSQPSSAVLWGDVYSIRPDSPLGVHGTGAPRLKTGGIFDGDSSTNGTSLVFDPRGV